MISAPVLIRYSRNTGHGYVSPHLHRINNHCISNKVAVLQLNSVSAKKINTNC